MRKPAINTKRLPHHVPFPLVITETFLVLDIDVDGYFVGEIPIEFKRADGVEALWEEELREVGYDCGVYDLEDVG